MQFNSHVFILLILPCSAVGYFLTNKLCTWGGKIFLLVLSLVFYLPVGLGG